ncbi:MAG: MAPEG family protein [Leptospiraceae bacterium]|nr:MAPEG family protein [Leptospiraceae bacterium]
MDLIDIILYTLALYVIQLFLQEVSHYGLNLGQILGSRDNPPELNPTAARLDRARNNMLEALPIFLGLALSALVLQGRTGPAVSGATVFLIARILYVPLYGFGVPVLRSVAWLTAMGGMLQMALSLVS